MCIVDVMIPVWKPDKRLQKCVERLLKQTVDIRRITLVLSVDSAWNGEKVEKWFENKKKVEIRRISRESFNHGGTRHDWTKTSDADYFLFLVQDAVPVDNRLAERLINCIKNKNNAVAYARQIPFRTSDEIEKYGRYFNYPPITEKKTGKKLKSGGIKDCFTSNVCAAYRRDWYEKVGGFEMDILLSEDSVFAGKALMLGADVVYCAEAKVFHSHYYGYRTQWKRNFDIGVVHRQYEKIFKGLSSEQEGVRLVKYTAVYLLKKKKVHLLLRLFVMSAVRYVAFECGKYYELFPRTLVERWSWDKEYWRRKEHGRKQK